MPADEAERRPRDREAISDQWFREQTFHNRPLREHRSRKQDASAQLRCSPMFGGGATQKQVLRARANSQQIVGWRKK